MIIHYLTENFLCDIIKLVGTMKKLEEIINLLKLHEREIRERFGVREIGIFGSYVRGDATMKSDIDILVEFKEGFKTLDNYMDLKFYLEDLLEVPVDLVSKTALKPGIKSYILEEVVYV